MAIALPKITPAKAAELAGKSAQFIRIGMQRNLLDPPIGKAFKLPGSERYCYDIRPQKLAEYLGVTVEAMYKKLGFDIDIDFERLDALPNAEDSTSLE